MRVILSKTTHVSNMQFPFVRINSTKLSITLLLDLCKTRGVHCIFHSDEEFIGFNKNSSHFGEYL
jgi:hypothetical protein